MKHSFTPFLPLQGDGYLKLKKKLLMSHYQEGKLTSEKSNVAVYISKTVKDQTKQSHFYTSHF